MGLIYLADLEHQLKLALEKATDIVQVISIETYLKELPQAEDSFIPIEDTAGARSLRNYVSQVRSDCGLNPSVSHSGVSNEVDKRQQIKIISAFEEYCVYQLKHKWKVDNRAPYENSVRMFVDTTGVVFVDGVTKASIRQYKEMLASKYPKQGTQKQKVAHLKAFFRWLLENTDYIDSTPWETAGSVVSGEKKEKKFIVTE